MTVCPVPNYETIEARYGEGTGSRASIGLLALSTDRVGEAETANFLGGLPDVAMYTTRVSVGPVGTPETLRAITPFISGATELIVPGSRLDVVGFGCTSGSVAIGLENIRNAVQSVRPGVTVCTPIEGAAKALRTLGARRISLVVPYQKESGALVAAYLESEGLGIDRMASFELGGDLQMNRVDPHCIASEAVRCMSPRSDAMFISCTGLLTSPIVESLEKELGKPLVTSNQALAWDCLRSAGVHDPVEGRGLLLRAH